MSEVIKPIFDIEILKHHCQLSTTVIVSALQRSERLKVEVAQDMQLLSDTVNGCLKSNGQSS